MRCSKIIKARIENVENKIAEYRIQANGLMEKANGLNDLRIALSRDLDSIKKIEKEQNEKMDT